MDEAKDLNLGIEKLLDHDLSLDIMNINLYMDINGYEWILMIVADLSLDVMEI